MKVYELRNILDECDGEAEFLIAVKGIHGLNVYEVEKENIAFQPSLEDKDDFMTPLAIMVDDKNMR